MTSRVSRTVFGRPLPMAAALLAMAFATLGGSQDLPPLPDDPDTLPWSQVGEWSFAAPDVSGNPFDVEATATFTHDDGEEMRIPLFHVGDDEWRVRFPAVRTGTWRYRTRSDVEALDGHEGEVRVEEGDGHAFGSLAVRDGRLVVPTDGGDGARAVLYNVYMPSTETFDVLSELPLNEEERGERIEALLDEAAEYGFPALLMRVYNAWFDFEAQSYEDHDRENPDPRTFEVLEDAIRRAHARGMFIHLWAWGDESRKWTPVGVGGINGEADRRLQRYIAARLGPLPGWTMSYGFDLDEWVEPDEVRRWASLLHDTAAVPPVVTAREVDDDEGDTFELGGDKLDLFSTDDRPEDDFYALARERLAGGRPVIFERRFLHGRDDVWDAETTLRAMWQFTMAGGAGAIWGPGFEDEGAYPDAGPFQVFARFWEERFTPDLEAVSADDAEAEDGVTLRSPDGRRVITYQEDTDTVSLDLEDVPEDRRAVAVDARAGDYEEIEIEADALEGGDPTWEAPHESDWVVAVTAD